LPPATPSGRRLRKSCQTTMLPSMAGLPWPEESRQIGNWVWLADVRFPDGSKEPLNGEDFPEGWSCSGKNGTWEMVDEAADPIHVYGTSYQYVATGHLTASSGIATLESPEIVVSEGDPGYLYFWAWLDAYPWYPDYPDEDDKAVKVKVSKDGGDFEEVGRAYMHIDERKWYEVRSPTVPASYTSTIAVGASTDFGVRAAYSRAGPITEDNAGLDVVAPSGGGWGGIYTTDLVGSAGISNGANDPSGDADYTGRFSGTSAASPVVAGIAALMLSKNPNLRAETIRSILRTTADEIGPVPYNDGWNKYYGCGRVNAGNALAAVKEGDRDGDGDVDLAEN